MLSGAPDRSSQKDPKSLGLLARVVRREPNLLQAGSGRLVHRAAGREGLEAIDRRSVREHSASARGLVRAPAARRPPAVGRDRVQAAGLSEGLSAATVSRDQSILHSLLAWAVVTERIDRNVASGVPHPRPAQRKGNALTPQQVQALARAFTNDQDRLVFLTLVLTGVRRAELQALRWRDVNLIENLVRVVDSKTELGSRSIAVPPMLVERLWQHRRTTAHKADTDRVFVHPERGTIYRYETFSAALGVRIRRGGHGLSGRHTPVPRPPGHEHHKRCHRRAEPGGADDQSRAREHGDDAPLSAARRGSCSAEEAEALERRLLGGLVPQTGTEEPQTALTSGSG